MKAKTKRSLEEGELSKSEKLNKKQKKNKGDISEHSNHRNKHESLDNQESKIRTKHKQGKKKKKKMKEILSTEDSKEKAVSYLKKWKQDRQNWKFEKVRQVWLLKHMLEDEKVPDSVFPILVEYLNGAMGHARQVVMEKALDVVKVMEKYAGLSEQGLSEEDIAKQCPKKVSEQMYERAREILQCLQEGE